MVLVMRLFLVKLLYFLIILFMVGINLVDLEGLSEYFFVNIIVVVKSGCVLVVLKLVLKDIIFYLIFKKFFMVFKNES